MAPFEPDLLDSDIVQALMESGAIMRGHFVLSSGRHSDTYVEKFRLLEQPEMVARICQFFVQSFATHEIDLVAGPATGGMILAYETARQMRLPARYIESEQGRKTLRRGAHIDSGARVLVVDDVLTTGLSVHESMAAVKAAGGQVVAVGVAISRAEREPDFGCDWVTACHVQALSYSPSELPDELRNIPIQQPGTRKLAA